MDDTMMNIEEYIKRLPIETPNTNLIHDITMSDYAVIGDTISFRSIIPSIMYQDIMISQVLRWIEIKEHFDKNIRIYALSTNTNTEKYMQTLVSNHKGLNITVLPIEFRRLFNEQ